MNFGIFIYLIHQNMISKIAVQGVQIYIFCNVNRYIHTHTHTYIYIYISLFYETSQTWIFIFQIWESLRFFTKIMMYSAMLTLFPFTQTYTKKKHEVLDFINQLASVNGFVCFCPRGPIIQVQINYLKY